MSNAPATGEFVIVGIPGTSDQRYYWADTPKGREAALNWLSGSPHNHIYRVQFDTVRELVIVPPVAARLVEKHSE